MASASSQRLIACVCVAAVALAATWSLISRPQASGSAAAPSLAAVDVAAEPREELALGPIRTELEAQQQRDSADEIVDEDLDDEFEDSTGRVPNLERVRGLEGKRIVGDWPNGARCFEAEQTRDGDGEWQLNGSWKAWYPNGQVEELGAYRANREHGHWRWWYANAYPMAEGSFEDGTRVGRWHFTHETGAPMSVGDYRAGLREGRWTFWFEDGSVDEIHSGIYRAGELVDD